MATRTAASLLALGMAASASAQDAAMASTPVAPPAAVDAASPTESVQPAQDQAAAASASRPPADHGVGGHNARTRDLLVRGDSHYARGDYAGAIQAFAEAYALSGQPRFLFYLADSYERAGYYGRASDALHRYAPHATPSEQADIAQRIGNLEARIDGVHAGARLDRSDARDPAAAVGADDVWLPTATPVAHAAPGTKSGTRETIGWITTIGGGVLLATGAVAAVVRANLGAELDRCQVGNTCPQDVSHHADRANAAAVVTLVGVGGGVAALTTGLILLLTGDGDEAPPQTRVAVGTDSLRVEYGATF